VVEIIKQNFRKNKELFKSIQKQLQKDLDEKIQIEHVGSTAIPNMYGKNIIDILIGAEDNKEFNNIRDILEKHNFHSSEKSKSNIYQFFASTTDETKSGDIHIHLVMKETQKYKDFILLKDYLLNNKKKAKKYSDFKRNLIKDNITEREEYKKVKSEYVSRMIKEARNKNYKIDN